MMNGSHVAGSACFMVHEEENDKTGEGNLKMVLSDAKTKTMQIFERFCFGNVHASFNNVKIR